METLRVKNNTAEKQRYRKNLKLLNLYGITIETYEEMLAAQGGGCALCRTTDPGAKKYFAVDHCHVSLKVRGLLCTTCNTGLGAMKDDPVLLEQAAEYVRKHAA